MKVPLPCHFSLPKTEIIGLVTPEFTLPLGLIFINRYLEMYSFFLDFLNYQYIFIGISYSPAFQFYLCNTVFFSSFSFLPSPSFWSFWQYVNRLSFHRINSSCHYFDFYCVNFWSALLMCVDGSFCPGPVVIQSQTHTQTFINYKLYGLLHRLITN